VNQRTTYELLMAEKAEQCTVPDMADSIWSVIDTGLTATPGNINNNDAGQLNTASHAGKSLGWGKLSLFLSAGFIAIVTIVLLSLPKNNNKENKNLPVQPEHQPSPVQPSKDSLTLDPVETKKTTPAFSPTHKDITVAAPDSILIPKDSVKTTPIINSPIVDSVITSPQKLPDTSIISPGGKKPRGVRGINPDDYKIIPFKKDSTKGK